MYRKELSNETSFFIYLLEKYSEYKGISATDCLQHFEQMQMIDYIKQMYPMYHTERLENAFSDIDRKLINNQ